jgi:hypothetical protein
MSVKNYVKLPVEIQALLFDGTNHREITDWIDSLPVEGTGRAYGTSDGVYIPTLEGTMIASPGDYVIRGIHGEFYPCKPDIFEATYAESL